jgi:hypothetical protein
VGISLGFPIDEDAIEKYHALMEDVWGQRLLSEQLWEATKAFLQSELEFRKAVFAKEMQLEYHYYELSEKYFNETGIRHLFTASSLLKAYTKSPLFFALTDLDKAMHEEVLESAKNIFIFRVMESGMPTEDARGIVTEYKSQIAIFIREGYRELIGNVIRNLEKLAEVRATPARSREKASPFPVWKAILLAILFGINIGAIVACFKTKHGSAFGTLAGGMPGWAAILLILGC